MNSASCFLFFVLNLMMSSPSFSKQDEQCFSEKDEQRFLFFVFVLFCFVFFFFFLFGFSLFECFCSESVS